MTQATAAYRLLYSPEFISPDDAAIYVTQQIGSLRDREYGGFIFQCRDNFVASSPLPGSATRFHTTDVFPDIDGQPQTIPQGLTLVGIYHSHPSLPDWQSSNFLSPGDIFFAITFKNRLPLLYLSNPDGSLLKYSAGEPEQTRELLALVTVPHDDPTSVSPMVRQLTDGTYSMEAFVQKVAEVGHLQVILPSDFWHATPKVSHRWQPGPPRDDLIPPQYLGPSFRTEENALSWMLDHLPASSEHTLSVGLVLKNQIENTYSPIYATPFEDVGFSPNSLLPANASGLGELPANHSISAFYYAPLYNPAEGGLLTLNGDKHFVSPQLMYGVLSKQVQDPTLTAYVWTQEGALLKFTSQDTEARQELLADLTPFGGPRSRIHQALANSSMTTTPFIQRVAAAGELTIAHAQGSWPMRGRVPADWTPEGPPLVKSQIWRLGPLFNAADDAVGDPTLHTAKANVGVVLHDTRRKFFASALLTEGSVFRYPNSSVVDLQMARRTPLPDGYVFDGLFFCPGHTQQQAYPQANEIFYPQALTYFFILIAHGFNLNHAYWRTPQGALIKYTSRRSREEDELISRLSAVASGQPGRLLQALNSGAATVDQLIRMLAHAGELVVLRTGGIWQQRGVQSFTSEVG